MTTYFKRSTHLLKVPKQRAAYSDRTAWLLAEMSRLAYERLPSELNRESFVSELLKAGKSDDPQAAFAKLVELISSVDAESGSAVQTALGGIKFKLVETFDVAGTEAFMATFKPERKKIEGFRVLVFRGTETRSTAAYEDIKTDLTANLVPVNGGAGRVHSGFQAAYEGVADPIAAAVRKHDPDLPLYIAGHSLGGALAVVAARCLDPESIAAVYTFGCPRVADDEFFLRLKVPIYRVVNAGDGVPRIPFGFFMTVLLKGLRLIPLNGTRQISEWLRRHFCGFTHWGHLVFLSPPKPAGSDDDLNFSLKFSPDIFWRCWVVSKRWMQSRGQSLVQDHDISDYCRKLGDYAEWRNPAK